MKAISDYKKLDTRPKYKQTYRKQWETVPEFSGWLTGVENDPNKAYCLFCDKYLHAHRLSLMKHTSTFRHETAAQLHLSRVKTHDDTNYRDNITNKLENNQIAQYETRNNLNDCVEKFTISNELNNKSISTKSSNIYVTDNVTLAMQPTKYVHMNLQNEHNDDNNYKLENSINEEIQNVFSIESTQLEEDYVDANDYNEPELLSVEHIVEQTEMALSPVTTHILDTSTGRPAENVLITFCKLNEGQWMQLSEGRTDKDGRLKSLTDQQNFSEGCYKLQFHVNEYFESSGRTSFYPFIEIVFNVLDPEEHYHVPLLLSPFGYSTYRGS